MNGLEYKHALYEKKVAAFNALRAGAAALAASRDKHKKLQVWAPNTHRGAEDQLEKQHLYGRDIGGVTHYFDNKVSSALDVICEDEFAIHYQIYGDIGRQAMYGNNNVGLFVHVRWDQLPISVGLYPGPLDRLLARDKLTAAAREGIPDRDQVAKATGWSRNDVRNLGDHEMAAFKGLLEQVRVGQSKLTRLVKGFLMLLECMERGEIDVLLGIQHTIVYGPQAVIGSHLHEGRAYVYNSRPSQPVHSAVLWRMCGAYPPPELAGSHINIPADGAHVFMVTEGGLVGNMGMVRLNPNLIYASMMTYAMDTGCTGYLQQALVIACSLQQNRYFSKVKLPRVVSVYDLMVPAFSQPMTKLDKPILSLPMAKSVGRLHQMLSFTAIRDNLTAAELSTTAGFDPEVSMRAYLKSQSLVVSRMSSFISELSLMEATSSMKIHDQLDVADFRDILSISIFEGLWLCQEARKTVSNGVIEALVRGVSDMSQDTTTYDVLTRELRLANVTFNDRDLPHGEFTVGWVNVTRLQSFKKVQKRRKVVRPIELVRECDFNPRVREVGKRRARFRRGGETANESPTAIPIEAVRRRGASRHARQASSVSMSSEDRTESPLFFSPAPRAEPEPALPEHTHPVRHSGSFNLPQDMPSTPPRRRSSDLQLPLYGESAQASSSVTSSDEILARSRIAAEIAQTKPVGADIIKQVVRDVASQMTEDELIAAKLKEFTNGKATEKERRSFTTIVKNIGAVPQLVAARSRNTFMDTIERKQQLMNYIGEPMIGNSSLAKDINVLIEKGRHTGDEESVAGAMRTKGKLWTGDVTKAPTYGLKYIANSESWDSFLRQRGIDPGEETRLDPKTTPTTMRLALAQKLAVMPHGSVEDVVAIHSWLAGAYNDRFPSALNRDDIDSMGSPMELEYRISPSSIGPRDPDESDSRWLVLASRVDHRVFDIQYLKMLCKHFKVPADMRQSLRSTYGLFDQRSDSMS
ncbi:capsid protein [Beauveria bassiana chrysovirus 1]|uniref:Capsid protein n=1 Tax=Beauveria bassiana chrysovirus 1 TaxID=2501274 RepID=A0A3Q9NMZ0_9VIRU|nr:capsid protein [Beauveria bassiana chrysovirus 1]